ncbi:MAG: hypothetical protein NC176_04710 [Treponema brennaborense]|nr:hypothetical protein [Prevotella sp.]MCM1407771.1 hypothetical protein [Treponema brennaborense]
MKIAVRYAHWGWTYQIKAAYISVGAKTYTEEDKILYCNHTGKSFALSNEVEIPLEAGNNQIRLTPVPQGTLLLPYDAEKGYGVNYPNGAQDEADANSSGTVAGAYKADGLIANLDYIKITGIGIDAGGEITEEYYSLAVKAADGLESFGTVSVEPNRNLFAKGTSITVKAEAASGMKFDVWTGTCPSADAVYTFTIAEDTELAAHFIPENYDAASENAGLAGYAAVCGDDGTPYTITGGAGGETITINNRSDLDAAKEKIAGDTPYIVVITARISSDASAVEKFDVGSNKTIIGKSTGTETDKINGPGLKNIYFNINDCENVIVKNLVFGEALQKDACAIHGAQFVWIDRCLFYSPDQDDKDKYDGLLDIKDGSRYVTISNCEFKDHWKAVLCGSSDTEEHGDSQMRLTFYGNYFHNVGSRMPLFRYGKLHMYNNYFDGADRSEVSCVNMRCGSEGLIEYNVFADVKRAVGFYFDENSARSGTWNVKGNVYTNVAHDAPASSTTNWKPCYTPQNLMTDLGTNGETLKAAVIANAGPNFSAAD